MSLKDTINDQLKAAMLSKDEIRTRTLRSIRAEILKMDKSGMNREMNSDEELALLNKQAKGRRESIETFQAAGRQDLVDKEQAELIIINEFLPAQMTREEAEKIVDKIAADTGVTSSKDIGKVMGPVMKELKGRIDGKIIQEIVKSRLSGES
ncbi:GatB/YqeY domain-containing protein [soil metagenome]